MTNCSFLLCNRQVERRDRYLIRKTKPKQISTCPEGLALQLLHHNIKELQEPHTLIEVNHHLLLDPQANSYHQWERIGW